MSQGLIRTVNPATEEVLREFRLHTERELEDIVVESAEAFSDWRKAPLGERLNAIGDLEHILAAARESLAEQITLEMGKTRVEALAEIDKCVSSCKRIRENFPAWMKHHEENLDNGYSVTREPLGLVLGIMPWNFPLLQVVRFAVPAMLCGNTVLLKHAPNVWGVAEFIDDLFNQALPHAVYSNLRVDVDSVERLIIDRRVRGVSITGSRKAGASVARIAGENLKKCVLELGGSDAYVVLDDADLDLAAEISAKSRLLNAGQSCVCAKRFIVTKKNAREFSERFRVQLEGKTFGDPNEDSTAMGPLARKDLRDQLHEQVKTSVEQGANLSLGGSVPEQKGFYYPATLLTNVRPGQAAFDEELFGPAAAVIEAENEKDAFRLANLSRYGLGGGIFSRDEERARELARLEMDSGMVAVNDFVRSDAIAPFGGVKDSGLGREFGREGSFEFTNLKSVFSNRR